MGPNLRQEVEKQLIKDLCHYVGNHEELFIDWSESYPAGHSTTFMDGLLENWSGVIVRNNAHDKVAEGWLDFIHGGDKNPLHVFLELITD